MRYYDLSLTKTGATTPYLRWTSHPKGVYDPGALNIEFDMPTSTYSTPMGAQTITVHGISLQNLNAAQDLVGMQVTLKGGMAVGLPLANPKQAGVLIVAEVFQSFGNWEGTDMTLDLVIVPSTYSYENPGNIVLNWVAGTSLGTTLKECLQVAYPEYPIVLDLSENLVSDQTHTARYSTLEGLAQWVGQFTRRKLLNQVYITIQSGKIHIYDSFYDPAPIPIAFTDLVGQPTWIEANIMQVKTVMRADIQVGSMIQMPQKMISAPGFILTSANSLPSSLKYRSTFTGKFQVIELRQIGNFRTADGASWVTIMNCAMVPNG